MDKARTVYNQIIDFTKLLTVSNQHGLVIHGQSGTGKTEFVRQALSTLKQQKIISNWKYAKAHFDKLGDLYKCLYNNNDCVLVLDESEDLLKRNSIFKNLMLTILEPGKEIRMPHYFKTTDTELQTKAHPDRRYPQKFKFTGKIIFITNKDFNTFNDAIQSRCIDVPVHLTKTEIMGLIEENINEYNKDINHLVKKDVFNFLKENKKKLKRLDFRTFRKLLDMASVLGDKYKIYAYNITG
jgi:Cdc6-like AAA superfamily ATPase